MGILSNIFKGGIEDKVGFLELYGSMLSDLINQASNAKPANIGSDQIHIGYDQVSSNTTTKVYYYIKALPKGIENSILQAIREHATLPGVRINFNLSWKQHKIDWNSTTMKDNRYIWNKQLDESANTEEDYLGTAEDAKKSEREIWLMQSWRYVSKADREGKALLSMNAIVEICTIDNSAESYTNLYKSMFKVEEFCAMSKIGVKRARGNMLDFIQYTSPLLDMQESLTGQIIPSRILVDEIIADMTPYTPGKLSEVGIFLGVDVITNMFTYMCINEIIQRSLNVLVAAGTSGGKSFMAKCIVRESSIQRMNCIILDRDGEYKGITDLCGGECVDLSKTTGLYFDSMQIGSLTGVEEIDAGLYVEAIRATTGIFNALMGGTSGMTSTERKIFQDAYNNVLNTAGVEKGNRDSWKNSEKLRYHDIYAELVRIRKNSHYVDLYGRELVDFVDKLSVYFEPNGIHSHMFQVKIGINDIIEKKMRKGVMVLDICLYLDEDIDQTVEGQVEQTIKFITANYLAILLTNYYYSLGESTGIFVEEFNRYVTHSGMKSLVLNLITGNRKRNAATFLMTNNPQAIVSSGEDTMAALKDNIKNLIIGKIESTDTIEKLCTAWNIPHCAETLTLINEDPDYKNCFLTRLENKEIAVVRQIMPDEDALSPIFSSGKHYQSSRKRR